MLAVGGVGGYLAGQYNKEKEVKAAQEEAKRQAEAQKQNKPEQNARPAHEQAPPKTTIEPTCNADELTLTTAPGEGGPGAGSMPYTITLENTGDRTCTLGGFPGVSLVNDNGNMIGEPAGRVDSQEEQLVTLEPGQSAQSTISVATNNAAESCTEGATKLRVYPPNDTGYLSVATDITEWCGSFTVTPVVPVG